MQPPLTDAAARSGAAPEHAWPQGPGWPGCGDTALGGRACTRDSPTALERAQTSSAARAIAAGQKETTPAVAQTSNSYLLLGFHTNTFASANLG